MVELSIAQGNLTLHVKGADKLWALKSSLEIPLAHIVGVGPANPEVTRGWLARNQDAGHLFSRSHHGGHVLSGWQADFLGRA